ncbi:hypothetical protein SO802_002810 [Lithocarpus litseifolius]|uniref:Uncharacterized protein n=1 Tax=Lithocarpus litseifolius TaxID=425828 RepID=A0AAW2E3Y8_9ROSI
MGKPCPSAFGHPIPALQKALGQGPSIPLWEGPVPALLEVLGQGDPIPALPKALGQVYFHTKWRKTCPSAFGSAGIGCPSASKSAGTGLSPFRMEIDLSQRFQKRWDWAPYPSAISYGNRPVPALPKALGLGTLSQRFWKRWDSSRRFATLKLATVCDAGARRPFATLQLAGRSRPFSLPAFATLQSFAGHSRWVLDEIGVDVSSQGIGQEFCG